MNIHTLGLIKETTYVVLEEIDILLFSGEIWSFDVGEYFDIKNANSPNPSFIFYINRKNINLGKIFYRDFELYVKNKCRELTKDEVIIKDIIE